MLQPKDVRAAVRWMCGVDPEALVVTKSVGRALKLERCAMRYGLELSIREVAAYFGVTCAAIIHHTTHADQATLNAVPAVMERAAVERDLDLVREENRRRADALERS